MTVFPFSAIVGQETLRRALLLGVIQPRLGGVLVRGIRGAAKTTAVRALAELLPAIKTVAGCPCQRLPGEEVSAWPLPPEAPLITRKTPLIELPLGASEDRVLGALHLERALRGERACDPGLLAAANRGILYIDEVNLLPDALVDLLLDAAASGMHRLEREGLSLSHPARFLLVGTMNPEEGELRPQLLDRFGLAVDIADLKDVTSRAEAVRRRLAFEADPVAFRRQWAAEEAALSERIVQARAQLAEVRMPDALVQAASERCLAAGVEGLRADLTICLAATAWAAFQGRLMVEAADLDAVAELALAHRRKPSPPPSPSPSPPPRGQWPRQADAPEPSNGAVGKSQQNQPPQRDDIAGEIETRWQPPRPPSTLLGQGRQHDIPARHGRAAGTARQAPGQALAWAATLRSAALAQRERGRRHDNEPLILHADDLRYRQRWQSSDRLLLFVIDASGSMAAWRRMRATKAAVLSLMRQAYRQRDRIALLTFGGADSRLVLPPTRGLVAARRALEDLAVGGSTPLAHGLETACQFVRVWQRRQRSPIGTVVLSDGRANVPLHTADPWADALAAARRLAAVSPDCAVVDTETGWPRFGRAAELAHVLHADCLALDAVLDRRLSFRGEAAS